MTGLVKCELPFQVSKAVSSKTQNEFYTICDADLRHMETAYIKEMPELQNAQVKYESELRRAKHKRRLKSFPKSLSEWTPEGGHIDPALACLHVGLKTSAKAFDELFFTDHVHPCEQLYISEQHSSKRASIVSFHLESTKFGIIDTIFQHTFC